MRDQPRRRLSALVDGLPLEAAVWREEMAWTVENELHAQIVEGIDTWGRLHALLLGAKRSWLGKPIRIPRPGSAAKETSQQVTSDPVEVARWLAKHTGGRR